MLHAKGGGSIHPLSDLLASSSQLSVARLIMLSDNETAARPVRPESSRRLSARCKGAGRAQRRATEGHRKGKQKKLLGYDSLSNYKDDGEKEGSEHKQANINKV